MALQNLKHVLQKIHLHISYLCDIHKQYLQMANVTQNDKFLVRIYSYCACQINIIT